jgi:beta-lactamase class A
MNFQELEQRNKVLERRWKIALVLLLLFVISRPLAVYVGKKIFGNSGCDSTEHIYINKMITCQPPVINKAAYTGLRKNLSERIDKLKSEGKLINASVFFRDLNNGPTFNVNEDVGYIPASLLKLPLFLTYYKLAETDPGILERELAQTKLTNNVPQRYPPSELIEQGERYKVDELLRRLVVYSDNRALEVLLDYLMVVSPNKDLFTETYKELGIIETEGTSEEAITAKSYASMFRLLYNASYVSPELSEKALKNLSEVEFDQGLKKGVPQGISIAHKFGERIDVDSKSLHDCGIVYYPDNPYLLCVMASGYEFEQLSDLIGEISKSVYEEVDSRKLD